ncbi:lipolytic protein-like protein G-D-S-L family [Amniculicola lignicola CBS 123094]|uniref:Lipolytic protein-like protein G-D-S-L family n=1 Tax=Amniculicola lignicola CBS 123094 TaxID=1392246 RepID=A0A6A5WRQ9_9PLEO|nr:lipolytic protein-like protein G-D-S-L family [Amniculicola lignicola CBS 123094]
MKGISGFLSLAFAAVSAALPNPGPGAEVLSSNEKRQDANHWVAAWTSMPQLVESGNMPPSPFSSGSVLKDATLRQTFYITLTAPKIKIAFTNTFGGSDLPITAASVGLPAGGAAGVSGIQASPIAAITVGGKSSFTVPKGQVVVSDEIDFAVKAQTNIAVSVYSQAGQSGSSITGHPGSRTTSWFVAGNKVNATTMSGTASVHWYFVSTVHAYVPSTHSALVILGDSITDGRGSDDNKNNRWPDLVLARANAANITNVGFNNQAAGGNCVLSQCLGPSTVSRYQRDAITQPGVKYVMIFEGVNDLGNGGSGSASSIGDSLIRAFTTIIADSRKAGYKTIGGTITPFGSSSYSDSNREVARQKVNKWILTPGNFDYSVDFSKAIENPSNKAQIDAKFHGGDYLHPNAAGYKAMAEAFSLDIFKE